MDDRYARPAPPGMSPPAPHAASQRPNLPLPGPASAFNPLSTRTLPSPFAAGSPTSSMSTPAAAGKSAGPTPSSAPAMALPSPTGTPSMPSGSGMGGMRLSTMLGSSAGSTINENHQQQQQQQQQQQPKESRATISPVVSNKSVSGRSGLMPSPASAPVSGSLVGGLQPPPPRGTPSQMSPPVPHTSLGNQLARGGGGEAERERLTPGLAAAQQRDRERERARSNSIQSASGAASAAAAAVRKTPTPSTAVPGRQGGVSVSPRRVPASAIQNQLPMSAGPLGGGGGAGNNSMGRVLPPHVQLSAGPPPPGLGGPIGYRHPGTAHVMAMGPGMQMYPTMAGGAAAMAKEKELRDSWWKREKEREEEVAHRQREAHMREQEREREMMSQGAEMRDNARRKEMPPSSLGGDPQRERERDNKMRATAAAARDRDAEMRARDRDLFIQHQTRERERERDRETREKKYVSASVMAAPPPLDVKPSPTERDRDIQLQHRMQKHFVGGYRAPHPGNMTPGMPAVFGHNQAPSGSAPLDPREREKRNMAETMFGAPPGAYRPFFSPASAGTPEEHSYAMMERERGLEREKERERERDSQREREREREKSVQMQARQAAAAPPRTTTPVGMPSVLPGASHAGTPSGKPVKQQAIEVLNQPAASTPSTESRNAQPVAAPTNTEARAGRGAAGVKSTPASAPVTNQEVFSPTDTGLHAQQASTPSLPATHDPSQSSGKAARPKLDHAANEAEQAHRRQSTNTHATLGHGLPSAMNAPQALVNAPPPASVSKSAPKRKRSDVYPPGSTLGQQPDDEVQIVGVSHVSQNRLIGDDGLGGRIQPAPVPLTGNRKKSSKHHPHAAQPAMVAQQQQPSLQNPQAVHMPIVNQINPQTLSVPPSRHLQVRSDAIEHYLRILGIEALRKHLGRVVYRGTDFLVDGELLASHVGGTLDVDIPGTFLPYHADGTKAWCLRNEVEDWIEEVSPSGKAVLNVMPGYADRQLWGTDVYTDDSDLLAVLVHAAWLRPILPSKNGATDSAKGEVRENKRARNANDDLRVRLRIAPKLVRYVATERAGILSRGWGNSHDGVSIVVESIERIKRGSALNANSRRNAKARMKSYLDERAIALGLNRDSLEYPSPPILEQLTFLRGREIGFRLSVAALGDWLRNPEKQEQGTGQQEETLAYDSDLVSSHSKIRNIWNKDLLLENATDRFRLSLTSHSNTENPVFDIYAFKSSTLTDTKAKESSDDNAIGQVIVKRIPTDNVQFTDSGMFVRSGIPVETAYGEHRDNGKGWFVQVERFAWIDRRASSVSESSSKDQSDDFTSATDGVQNHPSDEAVSELVQAMDVDEAPVAMQPEDSSVTPGLPMPAASDGETVKPKTEEVSAIAPEEATVQTSREQAVLDEDRLPATNGTTGAEASAATPQTQDHVEDSVAFSMSRNSPPSPTLPSSQPGGQVPMPASSHSGGQAPTSGTTVDVRDTSSPGGTDEKGAPTVVPGSPAKSDRHVARDEEGRPDNQ